MMEYHGRRLRLRLEGESHSPEMRVTIWGLPVGEPVDKETLLGLLARRRPGQSPLTTGRNEKDEPEFLSGARDGMLTGEPVVIRFANEATAAGGLCGHKDDLPAGPCRLSSVFTGRSHPQRGRRAGRPDDPAAVRGGRSGAGPAEEEKYYCGGTAAFGGRGTGYPAAGVAPQRAAGGSGRKKTAGMERGTHPPDGGGGSWRPRRRGIPSVG